MSEQWFSVGDSPNITISCSGNVTIRGGSDSSIVAKSNGDFEIEGTTIDSKGDLKLLVPRKSSLTITNMAGDLKVKGIGGDVLIHRIAGDAIVAAIGGGLQVKQSVQGDLRARDISDAVSATEVFGDVKLRRVGGLELHKVMGDVAAVNVTSNVHIGEVYGDLTLRSVTGDLEITNVHGDAALSGLAGLNKVSVRDDIRIKGSLTAGKHEFKSHSTISVRWPKNQSATFMATAPVIFNKLELSNATEGDGTLTGTVGSGDAIVTLHARNRISIRPTAEVENEQWQDYAEFEFDFSGIGERISEEVNQRMVDWSEKIGPEFNTQAEKALRKAQAAIDRAINQMETNLQKAERRTRTATAKAEIKVEKAKSKTKAKAAKSKSGAAPSTPPKNTKTEELKILKMLEEGVISVDEANELLAAL